MKRLYDRDAQHAMAELVNDLADVFISNGLMSDGAPKSGLRTFKLAVLRAMCRLHLEEEMDSRIGVEWPT